jgi:hypothetical protein
MFYIITLASALVTFLFVFLFFKHLIYRRLVIGQYVIHHSCFGVLLVILGLFIVPESSRIIIMAVGTGIYLSHIVEEIYFIKTSIWLAPFVFITKAKNDRNKQV